MLTTTVAAVRQSATRAKRRVRDLAWIATGLPYTSMAQRPWNTPEDYVRTAARRAKPPFTFVQVGSNDGRTDDPLFNTIMACDVRGLLVEPVPEVFERLRVTYSGKQGLTFVNAAVADVEGQRGLHWLPPAAGDPVWADQLGSFSRNIVLGHAREIPDVADRVVTLSVPCHTLPSLVAAHGLAEIDLLHVDAEGSDLMILRSIDFGAPWTPRCILYEQKHLGADRAVARDLLRAAGYTLIDLENDAFAFRGLKARFGNVLRR